MGSLEKGLFLACFREDVDDVKYYLDQGANMNIICSNGRTPFGAAAELGNVEILQLFLDRSKNKKKNKLKSSSDLKQGLNNSMAKANLGNISQPNLGYFVCTHNEQGSLDCSIDQGNIKLNKDDQGNNYEVCSDRDKSHSKLRDDGGEVMVSTLRKTAYDLATFNDPFVRRDPRFESKYNSVEVLHEDGELTPDGMDKLEWDKWDMEIPGKTSTVPIEDDDAWYYWYTEALLQTSSFLDKKPSSSDIDIEDQFGCRALHYATIEGHIDAVKLLINAGCKVNVGDADNLTPLHMAAARDTPEVVKLLIAAGANVHHKTIDRISPLHVSASRGLLNNVKLLIQAGAHINTLDSSDRTPLFMAVSRSHEDVVKYLLQQGAKVNLEEIHGYTPLYEAVWQKNTTVVKMLLDAGAKITQSHHLLHYAVLHRHKEMVSLLISAGSIINLRDENGDTPLIVAAKTHQTDIARLLLMNGASINSTSYVTGNTPLHEVIRNMSGGCHKFNQMFSILEEFNVDLEVESDAGYTSLCLALYKRFDEAAATLIRHGADVNHPHIHHLNLFTQLLLLGNRFLSELFIFAGYRFRDIQLSNEPTTPLERWMSELKINPMKLCDLCRIAVRTQFKSKIYEKVSALVLPSAIKTFLKLEDITCETNCV
ncbi:hypothetical protein RUM43_009152 [Polyplax serrata]|uniref:SOCS box domain-containing protein n=1 Tax=Polyplax serrata TaxID=468196 RepID=A0AAN8S4B7_POLSC